MNLGVNAIIGLVAMALLILAADEAVKRFVGLANYFKLSTTFVGMTVVSLATSIPEISAHMTASAGILAGSLDYQTSSAIVFSISPVLPPMTFSFPRLINMPTLLGMQSTP